MSSKTSRQAKSRSFRRAFKRGIDIGAKVSGRFINRYRYGQGVNGRGGRRSGYRGPLVIDTGSL